MLHHADNILIPERFPHIEHKALTAKIIHYNQRPKSTPIKLIIGHKIRTPALICMSPVPDSDDDALPLRDDEDVYGVGLILPDNKFGAFPCCFPANLPTQLEMNT